jgi:exonuclease VII small subunit
MSPARSGAQEAAKTPRAEYDEALAHLYDAQARVDNLYRAHRELEAEAARLDDEQRAVAARLEEARARTQRYLVEAYITGAAPAVEESLVHQESTTNIAYKTFFTRERSEQMKLAVAEQQKASADLDARAAELAVRRGSNSTELDQANLELDRAVQVYRQADVRLRQAEREAAERARAEAAAAAAEAARTATTRAPAPAAPAPAPSTGGGGSSGNAQGPGWDKLRQCESGGNYQAISSGGTYRGAYQFDYRTWQSMGGSGDPAAASPAEQDLRAQMLFDRRGAQPWPHCGKYLL